MRQDYYSFLICDHGDHKDVFLNGLPVGIIQNNAFTRTDLTAPDGTKYSRLIGSFGVPFSNVESLKAHLKGLIDLIDL